MIYPPPMEARCVFIDGPVSVFIHEADPDEVREAYVRLGKAVEVAATNFARIRAQGNNRDSDPTPMDSDPI